jgi:hypothetical protein
MAIGRGLGPAGRRAFDDIRKAMNEARVGATQVPLPPVRSDVVTETKRPDESSDDYLSRVLFGGRAGLPGTAAGYGDSSGQYVSPWSFPDSSRVQAYQWDEQKQQLRVRFIKYSTPWVYENIDLAVFQMFDAAPSKGRFINQVLNSYPYRRASDEEEQLYFTGV